MEPLDFSVNVNPYGTPERILRAAAEAVRQVSCYPDPYSRRLIKQLSQRDGIGAEHYLAGCGASDIIFRTMMACRPGSAIIEAPSFSEYERALRAAGSSIHPVTLKRSTGFSLETQLDQMKQLAETEHAEMIVLCEPNNPTGKLTDRNELIHLLHFCEERGIKLVIDESFIYLCDFPEKHTMVSEILGSEQLIIIRSFTKLFAMPGIRLGYGIFSDPKLIEKARNSGAAWPVSVGAEAAGLAALESDDEIRMFREKNIRERRVLREQLLETGQLDFVSESEANFLLFHAKKPLAEELAEMGILVRDCRNYRGLDECWIRVSVKRREENEKLVKAVRKCFSV